MDNINLVQKFVDELESGKYAQTKHTLKRKDPKGGFSYCCLGVFTEQVMGRSVKAVHYDNDFDEGSGKWYGLCIKNLTEDFADKLAVMNDEGKSFGEIAQVIRDKYGLKGSE